MTWRGDAFELPTWEPRTDVTGSSPLLATPTAWLGRRPSQMEGDADRWHDPARSNELSDQMAAIHLLPTPTAADGTKVARNKTSGRKPDSKHHTGTTMQDVAYEWAGKLLPTPVATNDRKSTRAMTASQANGRRSGGGQSSPPGLEDTARLLAGDYPEHMPPPESLPPSTAALLSSGASTSPPSDGGKPSTAPRPRLSPEFVEWMMGTPRCNECGRGWTDSACQHSVTAFTSTSAGSSGTRS
jgi:hypothetical protein